jgi:hypothetical protein
MAGLPRRSSPNYYLAHYWEGGQQKTCIRGTSRMDLSRVIAFDGLKSQVGSRVYARGHDIGRPRMNPGSLKYLIRRTPAKKPPSALVADSTTGLGILPYRVARPSLVLGFVAVPLTVNTQRKIVLGLASSARSWTVFSLCIWGLSRQGRVEHVEHVSDGQGLRIPPSATCPGFQGHIRFPPHWDSKYHHSDVVACAV